MTPPVPFKLGDKVLVTELVEKQQTKRTAFAPLRSRYHTDYITKPCDPFLAIYIGYRTAQTGYTIYDEDGPIFRPTGTFTYALVVRNPRQNPVKVSLSCLR